MIKLENVSFSYNNKKKVLNNLNIEFKKRWNNYNNRKKWIW